MVHVKPVIAHLFLDSHLRLAGAPSEHTIYLKMEQLATKISNTARVTIHRQNRLVLPVNQDTQHIIVTLSVLLISVTVIRGTHRIINSAEPVMKLSRLNKVV